MLYAKLNYRVGNLGLRIVPAAEQKSEIVDIL